MTATATAPDPIDWLALAAQAILDHPDGQAPTTYLQRRLGIGWNKANRLVELLQERGAIHPPNGDGLRLIRDRPLLDRLARGDGAALPAPPETSVTLTGPGGETLFAGTADQFRDAADAMARKGRMPMKDDPDFRKHNQDAYQVTADELRQFIERFEQLEAEKQDLATSQKDLMAEAKGRGYDTKVMRKVIALRRRKPDELAEEEAVLDLYKTALGMS